MKHVGIICEYNPFHKGHAYLLQQVRRAETVICVMSGSFTQRGEAAVLPPVARAEMALRCGADLVLELPFPFAAGSARYFATAGVRALQALGADTLAFGSERADGAALRAAAQRTLEVDFEEKVANVAENAGVAAAYFEAAGTSDAGPNDILAVEYVRAILQGGEALMPYPILRRGAGYHDTDAENEYPSATALRRMLAQRRDVTQGMPAAAAGVLKAWLGATGWGMPDVRRLGTAMLAMLRCMPLPSQNEKSPLTGGENGIADCGGGLLERLIRAAAQAVDYDSLCSAAATKKYTNGRIRRTLLYLLAGVTQADLAAPPAYLRLLGANERGRAYLAETRKTRTVPVVTRPSDIAALGKSAARARRLSEIAEGLYALCFAEGVSPAALITEPPVML